MSKNNINEVTEMRSLLDTMGPICCLDNPVSFCMTEDYKLYEGLIRTYPIEKVVDYVREHFGFPKQQLGIRKNKNDQYEIVLVTPLDWDEEAIEPVTKVFDTCGYFLACGKVVSYKGMDFNLFQFEKKFEEDATEEIKKNNEYLYHVSPVFYKEKILSGGLQPRSKNSVFRYPGRIYLSYDFSDEDLIDSGRMLYFSDKRKHRTTRYCVYKISTKLLPDNVRLCYDSKFGHGVYTTENIPPSCFSNVGEFDIVKDNDIKWIK